MKQVALICLWLVVVQSTSGATFVLKGRIVNNPEKVSSLTLYKWHTMFRQERIATVPITDDEFIYFSKENPEVDVYMLANPSNAQFIQFVWDGEVMITIDSISTFHQAAIKDSPLSSELCLFNKSLSDSLFGPIHRLDTLISNQKMLCPKGCAELESLTQKQADAVEFSRKYLVSYTMNYIRKHPDSFISLFLLTKYGTAHVQDQECRTHFMLLSERLKKHSRATLYML